jgi:TetR/AcrR family transcriptional repressor of mexJK operon
MSSSNAPGGATSSSRGAGKRAAILESAQQVFFANGFVGTSVDEVAAKASVSKQTVYKHFTNKEALFREVVMNVVRARDVGVTAEMLSAGEGSFEEQLRSFARFFLKGVMQPDVLRLRRLVIGEVGRFPQLGEAFHELGPKRAADQMALALRELSAQHGFFLQDPYMAAQHLLCLILSIPLDQAMLLGDEHGFTEAALDRYADEGVGVFLRAYDSSNV